MMHKRIIFSVGGRRWRLGQVKFSYSNNPESDFIIEHPNVTKKNSGGWEGEGLGCG